MVVSDSFWMTEAALDHLQLKFLRKAKIIRIISQQKELILNNVLRQVATERTPLPGAPIENKLSGEGALDFYFLDFFVPFCIKTNRTKKPAMK
ncbi:hypothetical protein FVR03_13000 [Pontibacter qinzhouensis]|uniref:Uncharacterized protein n=1 Tax=Pontibacter qinzhouensis TaxID=2603253 RepID=A0A5C8K4Z2_9BACT|nr:hypothetical protein [Pontibacter qinzhouensis]TXK44945.1 hypothetical protein FVR03_13000 [Pontibacter qinzhouensis]